MYKDINWINICQQHENDEHKFSFLSIIYRFIILIFIFLLKNPHAYQTYRPFSNIHQSSITYFSCLFINYFFQSFFRIIRRFRIGEIWVLICTDLMARGVDFKGVQMVINYDLPQVRITENESKLK